jgi:hypothetical protein
VEQAETRAPEQAVEKGLTCRSLFGGSARLAAGTMLLGTPAVSAVASIAHASPPRRRVTPTPAGFKRLLVYIAEGPASASSIRDVDAVLAFQQE